MKDDNTNKTKQFVKKGAVLWVILIAIYSVTQHILQVSFSIRIETKWIRYFKDLNNVLLFYLIGSIPIILMLSILLLYAERAIDKFATFIKRKDQDIN